MSDEELIYLMREKNEDAELLLVEKYDKIIQRTSFLTVGYFAYDSEVKSTAYAVLMQCVQSYDDKLNSLFGTYYTFCLKNRLRSLLKQYRYGVKRHWMYDYQDITEIDVKDHMLNDPIQRYIVEETCADIVAHLKPLECAIFEKSREGYTSAEVAELEGVSVKKVYNTIHKVKKMLKK